MDYRMCENMDNYQGYQQRGRQWVPQIENSPMPMPSSPTYHHGQMNMLPRFDMTFSDGGPRNEYYDYQQQPNNVANMPPELGLLEYFYPNDQPQMKPECKREANSCFDEDLDFDFENLTDLTEPPQQPTGNLYQTGQAYFLPMSTMNMQRNVPVQMETSRSPSQYDNAGMMSMSPPAPSPCYFNWNNDLGSDGMSSTAGTPPPSPPEQKVIKPRRTNKRKKGHLWEFVLNLLKDPETNPSIVKWEDKNLGIFRFVKSKEAAKLWGIKKENKEMTYEKMSRAMRYTREVGVFSPLPDAYLMRRLCYRFGERAEGWVEVAQSANTIQQ